MKDSKGNELKAGDRVKFVGHGARMWETVGSFERPAKGFARVRWNARPDTPGYLHPSQIEKIL